MEIDLQETTLTRERLAVHFLELQPEISFYIARITRNKSAAEDLASDTFRKALEKRDDYKGPDFKNWIYAIARNVAFDHLRARRVRTAFLNGVKHAVYGDDPLEEEKNESSFLRGIEYVLGLPGNDPEGSAIVREQLHKILGFIDTELIENLRDAYHLHLQGYSNMEVGERLGIKEQAATSRIFRARRKIREYASESLTT